jgi:hypothetical protein
MMDYFVSFFYPKKSVKDFGCQFDESCIDYVPDKRTCAKHGPIKFKREDFGGCIECNDKWRNILFFSK